MRGVVHFQIKKYSQHLIAGVVIVKVLYRNHLLVGIIPLYPAQWISGPLSWVQWYKTY